MATDRQAQSQGNAEERQHRLKAGPDATSLAGEYFDPGAALKAKADPSKLSPAEVLGLQRAVGNAAVGRMLARSEALSRTPAGESSKPGRQIQPANAAEEELQPHDQDARSQTERSGHRGTARAGVPAQYDIGSVVQAKRQLGSSPPATPAAQARSGIRTIHRREDYQGSMGGTTYAADVAGNVAAAKAAATSEDMLPAINIDLSHSAARQAFFRDKMVEHLNRGMYGYYGDLTETHAYVTMKEQMDGYLGDVGPLSEASSAYNTFVPTANLAVKGMMKHFALQDSLGFEDDADFERQLTGDQKDALQKALLDNPALLSKTMSVTQKENELNATRTTLRGHLQGYSAIITGKAIGEVKGRITKNKADQKKINDKIAKAVEIAGYVQKAAELAATGAGSLSKAAAGELIKAPKTFEEGAKMAGSGAGHLATAVKIGMELYYAKELKDFESKITQAQGDLETLGAIQAKQELASKLTKLAGAKEAYKNAVDAYDNAIQDRRQHMAALAAKADEKTVGEKGAKGDRDFVGQVMLYMVSVRENRSLISNAQRAGDPATKAISAALSQLGHRRKGYQTNYESHGTVYRTERTGPDEKQLHSMRRNTQSWLGRAEVEKDLLDRQEASASKLMGSVGRGGNY